MLSLSSGRPRELQAITDLAPGGQWCRATQAADALTAMHKLVSEAISQGRDVTDPAAMHAQTAYRSAALIGASQTAARSSPLIRNTTRWPAACSTARTTTCGSPGTSGFPLTTTEPSATSAWPS